MGASVPLVRLRPRRHRTSETPTPPLNALTVTIVQNRLT